MRLPLISHTAVLLCAGLIGVVLVMDMWAAIDPLRHPVGGGRTWVTIRDDSGFSAPSNTRGQVTSPRSVVRKVLPIDFDPDQITEAELIYEMKIDPYHPIEKKHYHEPREGVHWADMRILVNGTVAVEKPGIELAAKGWHALKIDPALLVQGLNRIDITWTPLPEDRPDGMRYGYFYMAIDPSRNYGRSLSSDDRGSTFTHDTLNPGREDGPTGEYMVRLRVGIPLDTE